MATKIPVKCTFETSRNSRMPLGLEESKVRRCREGRVEEGGTRLQKSEGVEGVVGVEASVPFAIQGGPSSGARTAFCSQRTHTVAPNWLALSSPHPPASC